VLSTALGKISCCSHKGCSFSISLTRAHQLKSKFSQNIFSTFHCKKIILNTKSNVIVKPYFVLKKTGSSGASSAQANLLAKGKSAQNACKGKAMRKGPVAAPVEERE
jgi:hypothetical protein